jgi:drug/metabolite transporter (DMT)-like permease
MWLTFAFISPALYAISEIFDNFLVNKKFKHPLVLIFFTSLFNLLYAPVLFYFKHPVLPPLSTLPIFALLGFVNIAYLYPYYKGLQSDDTSIAVSFLSIERIMVPILAFIIVGEVLKVSQYVGIFLIVISVLLLGIHHNQDKFRLSKGVWHISLAALFLAFEGVFLKLLFEQGISVSTAIGGEAVFSLVFSFSLLLFPKIRSQVKTFLPDFIALVPLFFIEELFTFLGLLTEGYAISFTSVSVVKGITMTAPFFLLIYAWLGGGMFPTLFKEDLHRRNVSKKVGLFLVLIIGIILIKQ